MLAPSRIAIYTALSLTSVLAHYALTSLLTQTLLRYGLGLALPLAYLEVEKRSRVGLRTNISYYAPLAIALLTLGEAARAITQAIDGGSSGGRGRGVVHGSLVWSFVAEAEWWRSDFHAEAYYPKFALPSPTLRVHLSNRSKYLNLFLAVLLNTLSVIIYATLFLGLAWLTAFAVYQDHRGLCSLFFSNENGNVGVGWFYFFLLGCWPFMCAALWMHEEIEKRFLPKEMLAQSEGGEAEGEGEVWYLP